MDDADSPKHITHQVVRISHDGKQLWVVITYKNKKTILMLITIQNSQRINGTWFGQLFIAL